MTEAKPEPKRRSSFLSIMLLVVGLVIVAGVVLMFVPLLECRSCHGLGSYTHREWAIHICEMHDQEFNEADLTGIDLDSIEGQCHRCNGDTKMTLVRMWQRKAFRGPGESSIWRRARELRTTP